jgi:Ca-activated chloride channel homolog
VIANTSDNFRFAASVAEFGMLLRHSEFKSAASYENVLQLARTARGDDEEGYRREFIELVEGAKLLAKSDPESAVEETGDHPVSRIKNKSGNEYRKRVQ